jgi:hypothetical protein
VEPKADWEVRMELVNAVGLADSMTLEQWQSFVFPGMDKEL